MKYVLHIFLIVSATACYKDLGNYDYSELNNVNVEGILSNQWYEKYTYVDTLKIEPQISLAFGGSQDHLKYEWILIPQMAGYVKDSIPYDIQRSAYIIGKEKNLSYPLTERAGEYAGFFYVKDTLSGISYKTDFYLRLRTAVSEGWMLLCEENEKARLDMISSISATENLVSHNIWKNCDFSLGKPYKLTYNHNIWKSSRLVWCEKGTYCLDNQNLWPSEANNLIWQFAESPNKIGIVNGAIPMNSTPTNEILISSDSDLYIRDVHSIAIGGVFDYPRNREKNGNTYFKVSPHIGFKKFWKWPTTTAVILYDETNRRFMSLESNQEFPSELSFIGGGVEYSANTGKDLIHMEGNMEGYIFAVLQKPGTQNYDIYGMIVHPDCKIERSHYIRLKPANTDKITLFAFHPIYRFLFYATDRGDIYQFNMNTPEQEARKILSFPGEHISVIKFQLPVPYIMYEAWEKERWYWLYVAGYDTNKAENESGTMRMFDFPEVSSTPVKKYEFTNLGKIIDISYRYKRDEAISL